MSSLTRISSRKRTRRHKNAGHARKMTQAKQSTLSYAELFKGCGEPGQPVGDAPAQD